MWEDWLALAGVIGLSALMARIFLDAMRKKPGAPQDGSGNKHKDQ